MIDGSDAMVRIEDVLRIDVLERRGLVGSKTSAVERTREERVVDAEEHVALRIAGGEGRLGDDLARVACLQDLQLQASVARIPV